MSHMDQHERPAIDEGHPAKRQQLDFQQLRKAGEGMIMAAEFMGGEGWQVHMHGQLEGVQYPTPERL